MPLQQVSQVGVENIFPELHKNLRETNENYNFKWKYVAKELMVYLVLRGLLKYRAELKCTVCVCVCAYRPAAFVLQT